MFRRLLSVVLVAVVAACAGSEEPADNQTGSGEAVGGQSGSVGEGSTDKPKAEETADPAELMLVTGPGGSVKVISPDGTEVRELRVPSGGGGPSLQPTWAPSSLQGRHLVAWTELAEDGTFQIALADVSDGSTTRFEAPVAPFYYYWSPDAMLLGFLGQSAFSPLQMGVVDLQLERVELLGEGQPFYFDWRADSNALIAHVGDALSLLTRDDGAWTSEVLSVTPGLFQAPAWISSDRILVTTPASAGGVEVSVGMFAAQSDLSGQRLIVSDLGGRPLSTLAELEGAAAFEPDPDGLRVAFTDFAGPLLVLNVAGGKSVPVSDGRVAAFQWSPDGSRLLFMEVDKEAQALVPRVWDGSYTVTFRSFYPTRVFLLQYLPFWDQYTRSLTLWAPSGESFTYPAATAGGDRIMVQHLSQTGPVEVSRGVFASWSPVPVAIPIAPQS